MYNEFIGKQLIVLGSKNKSLINKKGLIIDETKNLFVIEENNREIKILKNACIFKIDDKIIDGKKICKRPEDRIKLIKHD